MSNLERGRLPIAKVFHSYTLTTRLFTDAVWALDLL